MRAVALSTLLALGLLAGAGTAVAANNTAPLADAGVDQTVPVDATVYLDANGSVDPDGAIDGVSWSVEAPDGETIAPACADCRRTEFEATTVGQYTATLTVTDDDGASSSDTLYVTVSDEPGPDVAVSGPSVTTVGSSATLTADVTRERASLQTLAWLVDGDVVDRDALSGASADASLTHSFGSTTRVRAVVYDTLGHRGSATHRVVTVRPTPETDDGGGGGGEPPDSTPDGPGNDTDPPDTTPEDSQQSSGSIDIIERREPPTIDSCEREGCADRTITDDGETEIYEANGQAGIQLRSDGRIVNYGDLTRFDGIERVDADLIRVTEGDLSDYTTERAIQRSSTNNEATERQTSLGSVADDINEQVGGLVGDGDDGGDSGSSDDDGFLGGLVGGDDSESSDDDSGSSDDDGFLSGLLGDGGDSDGDDSGGGDSDGDDSGDGGSDGDDSGGGGSDNSGNDDSGDGFLGGLL